VEEVNLTVHISGLRKALDRGGTGSAMIETVPTRGYRFVAPVSTGTAEVTLRRPGVLSFQPGKRDLGEQPTKNADAYRAYLQGRHEWNQRSKENLRRGIEHCLDPRFAELIRRMRFPG